MYFQLFKLHKWGKRSAAQPQTIYSEVPKELICMRQLKEKLTKHMVEHPIDFGTSEAETVLDFLYGAY